MKKIVPYTHAILNTNMSRKFCKYILNFCLSSCDSHLPAKTRFQTLAVNSKNILATLKYVKEGLLPAL